MGMSGHFPVAIEEGATLVRVGSAVFGDRSLPDSTSRPEARRATADNTTIGLQEHQRGVSRQHGHREYNDEEGDQQPIGE
jgi:hypothetical protein